MDIKKLQTLVVDALEDVKGQDIQLFDTTHITSLFDRVLVASGTSPTAHREAETAKAHRG